MRDGRGLRATVWVAMGLLALAGCASPPRHPDAFSFAVLGDTPYSEAEEVRYLEMLRAIDRLPLAFVIHVGDFHGSTPCSDALFEKRRREFAASAHPLIYTPGDNEWADCRGARRGNMDPLERLARLREVFFRERGSLGQRRIETLAQDRCIGATPTGCRCPAHPENRFWSQAGVRFVTLHVVGSDNNFGVDAASDAEVRCRDEANALWLEQALHASERSQTRALVIAMQANPWYSRRPVYDALLGQIQDTARRLKKPVLLIHGHTHTQRIDAPFTDALGHPVPGITRLETYGSPFVGWVRVDVDPDDPEVFTFEPRLQALVPPSR